MSRLHWSALTLCLVAFFAGVAHAQDAAVVQLNVNLKTVRQGTSGLEQKPTKAVINAKKLFEICTSLVPNSKQSIYFGNECDSLSGGSVVAFDKSNNGFATDHRSPASLTE